MATKYYSAVNCNRLFTAGENNEKEIVFEPNALIAGVWHGTYKTDDKEEHQALKKEKEVGVSEISEKEWMELTQKKTIPAGEFNPLSSLSSAKAEPPTLTQVESAGPVQSVVEAKAEAEAALPDVSVDEALVVGATDRAQSKGRRKGKK